MESVNSYLPEPSLSPTGMFNGLVDLVSQLGKVSVPGAGVVQDMGFASLLEQQRIQQERMQKISMISNIEKSEHEAKMAAIHNMRVS
ncbi:MAG: hypothetical protein PHC51_13385 [bacterium]|nr:hypothetical protein [bacterium]